jgi:hypothetical protein
LTELFVVAGALKYRGIAGHSPAGLNICPRRPRLSAPAYIGVAPDLNAAVVEYGLKSRDSRGQRQEQRSEPDAAPTNQRIRPSRRQRHSAVASVRS